MNEVSELFWSAALDEIKRGYLFQADTERFVCLACGKSFSRGVIYPDNGTLYEAEAFVRLHIVKEHGSMFDYLLQLNKKLTGLTDLQKQLLQFFYEGLSDAKIVQTLGGGSTSTIRNHRFMLREREKQAKVFLAIMELLQAKTDKKSSFINVPLSATMLDERYAITVEENEEILKQYFPEGPDGRLSGFPKKEKRKIAILRQIVKRFDLERSYSEKEVNEILKTAYDDYATLRRYLIEYGFMDRKDDGSRYWIKP